MYLIKKNLIYASSKKDYFKYDLTQKISTQINIEQYCEILFGRHNYKLRNLLGYTNSPTSNNIYSAFYQIFDLLIHNVEGDLVKKKKNFFAGYTPYEIQVIEERNEVWTATGAGHAVICYDLDSGKLKQTLGTPYDRDSEISYPESISAFKNDLYISEMGNRKITKINLENGAKSNYLNFEEPVWCFLKNEFTEIVLLDSGIFEIKNGQTVKIDH